MIDDVRIAYLEAVMVYYLTWEDQWSSTKLAQIRQSVRTQQVVPDWVGSFLKNEVNHKFPTKGRLIHPYLTMATQEAFARELKCFQKALMILDDYEIYPGIFLTCGSGRTAQYLAAWILRSHGPYLSYEQDGVTWDARLGREHHLAKLRFLRECCPQAADFIEACYRTKAAVRDRDGTLVYLYTLVGTVRSGHNDTTSGNTLINLLVAAVCLKRCHLTGRAIAAGDDLLVLIDETPGLDPDDVKTRMTSTVAEYGIKPEARVFRDIEDVTFISARWLRTGARYVFVPLVGRLVSRLWWTVARVPPKLVQAYQRGVCLAVQAVCGMMPIARGLTAKYRQAWLPVHYVREKLGLRLLGKQAVGASVASSLARVYGCTTSAVEEFDLTLEAIDGTCRISHPFVDLLRNHDFSEIQMRPCSAGSSR